MTSVHVVGRRFSPRAVLVTGELLLLVSGCTAASELTDPLRSSFSAECNQTDSTESCCLKQSPGQYERCGATPPAHALNPYLLPSSTDIPTTPIPDLPTEKERDEWEKDICLPHYEKCRSGKHDGRVWGESHCKACFSARMRYGYWPLRANGKRCSGA